MPDSFDHGYALLIGVGRSSYANWSLPVTVLDAQALRAILADPALCGYPADDHHLRLLHDETATRTDILAGLAWLRERTTADPDATAIVFYSGHGWLDAATGRYYLVPHDVKPFDLAGSALPASDFAAALHAVPARRLLVIVDACHAEGMATAKDLPALELPAGFTATPLPKGISDTLKQGAGRAVFTSARGTQKSWVRPDGTLSLYTYHLLEALRGAGSRPTSASSVVPGDTVVRLSHLMNHLGQAVPASARTLCHAEQTPFFDTATEDFPVALLAGGQGLPKDGWQAVPAPSPSVSYQATLSGSGAIAQGTGAVAAGAGGVAIGGSRE